MMYACQDERTNLPHNEYLGDFTFGDDSMSFGDAFIFNLKSEPDGSDKSERAKYLDMDDTFVFSAQQSGFATVILSRLLLCPSTGVVKWRLGHYHPSPRREE